MRLGEPNYWDKFIPKGMKRNWQNGLTEIQNKELGDALMDRNGAFQRGFDHARNNKMYDPLFRYSHAEKEQYRKGYAIARHDYSIAARISHES